MPEFSGLFLEFLAERGLTECVAIALARQDGLEGIGGTVSKDGGPHESVKEMYLAKANDWIISNNVVRK